MKDFKNFRIDVTQDDIDQGLRFSPESCPIARALVRKFQADRALVNGLSFSVMKRNEPTIHGLLKGRAGNFVDRFDSGDKVRPTHFLLYGETYDEWYKRTDSGDYD